jgi:hypothetical protein
MHLNCTVCNAPIHGEGTIELSWNLRRHMVNAHETNVTSQWTKRSAKACRTDPYDTATRPEDVILEKDLESGKALSREEVCEREGYDVLEGGSGQVLEKVLESGKDLRSPDSYDAATEPEERWKERVLESGKGLEITSDGYDAAAGQKEEWQERILETGKDLPRSELGHDAAQDEDSRRTERILESGKDLKRGTGGYSAASSENAEWTEKVLESGKRFPLPKDEVPTKIFCPVCENVVEGASGEQLQANLKEHLKSMHSV